MFYLLSHLTIFAQNFLIKGMIFAVFFGVAIGFIVFFVSRHDIIGFKKIALITLASLLFMDLLQWLQ